VSASKLLKPTMAQSFLDAGWSTFQPHLLYKSHWPEVAFKEVKESFSTQDCSACGNPAATFKE
jgi:transposase